jgi:hypothetical protein
MKYELKSSNIIHIGTLIKVDMSGVSKYLFIWAYSTAKITDDTTNVKKYLSQNGVTKMLISM